MCKCISQRDPVALLLGQKRLANWAEEHLLPVFERDRLAKRCVTYWVDARNLPSGLKAVAMVERGGGFRSQ